MKPDGTMICRVTILTYASVSNILAVTTDGEYCPLQSVISDISDFHLQKCKSQNITLSET
jgi:hypothetical protein